MNMNFGTNKTPAETIKERSFRETFFRDIYSCVHDKWYRKSQKEFEELKNIDQNYFGTNHIMMLTLINIIKCGTSLRLD